MKVQARVARHMRAIVLVGWAVAMGACSSWVGGNAAGRMSESGAAGWPGAGERTPDPAMIAAGRDLARRECSSCHAIDRTSASPRKGAPPLRDVLSVYESDNLAYRFIEGMRVGHDEMPVFDFDVRGADALIAYIGTISGPSGLE